MTENVSETSTSITLKNVAAVVVGNALEFYDFLTYAFFAVYIGRAFSLLVRHLLACLHLSARLVWVL